jgi:hypothetical protein
MRAFHAAVVIALEKSAAVADARTRPGSIRATAPHPEQLIRHATVGQNAQDQARHIEPIASCVAGRLITKSD